MIKRPSFQFYPGDWLHDISLRAVSVAARGLWIDLMCLMHQGQPYGYLKVNHKVIPKVNLARILGIDGKGLDDLLSELIDHGVCSVDEDGAIFCRRMVRDEEIRTSRAVGGSKGGNPTLLKMSKVNLPKSERLTTRLTPRLDQRITAPEEEDEEEDEDLYPEEEMQEGKQFRIEAIYQAYPRRIGKQAALKAIRNALKRIDRTDAVEWLFGRVKAFSASPAGKAGEFTPHPATWFNQGRYDDDDAEWNRRPGASSSMGQSPARVREPGRDYSSRSVKIPADPTVGRSVPESDARQTA